MSQQNAICPKCGMEPEDSIDFFCSGCGEDLRPLHNAHCDACGWSCMNGHRDDLRFCPQCGNALQKAIHHSE